MGAKSYRGARGKLSPEARVRLTAAVAALPRTAGGKIQPGYLEPIARRFGVSVSAAKMVAVSR